LLAAIFTIVLGSCVALWVRSDMKKEKAKRDAALAAGDGNQSPV
jgi:hypothetical protein